MGGREGERDGTVQRRQAPQECNTDQPSNQLSGLG